MRALGGPSVARSTSDSTCFRWLFSRATFFSCSEGERFFVGYDSRRTAEASFNFCRIADCTALGRTVPKTATSGSATMHTTMMVARSAKIPDFGMAFSTLPAAMFRLALKPLQNRIL
jgi:hypothetical protein